MLEDLARACESCDRPLSADGFALAFETADGVRRAYECECGAVTITVDSR
jgi:hypothetical protein